jgi:hypothetical protein
MESMHCFRVPALQVMRCNYPAHSEGPLCSHTSSIPGILPNTDGDLWQWIAGSPVACVAPQELPMQQCRIGHAGPEPHACQGGGNDVTLEGRAERPLTLEGMPAVAGRASRWG